MHASSVHVPPPPKLITAIIHIHMAVPGMNDLYSVVYFNGPFRKLSRAMLVTSFGGQCRKKTAISVKAFRED